MARKDQADGDKYYRAGIAMPVERKAEFDKRLQELGLRTLGDLATFFTLTPGVVDALQPLAGAYMKELERKAKATEKRKELRERIANMPAEALTRLLELAEQQEHAR